MTLCCSCSFLSIRLALLKQWLMLALLYPLFLDDISVPQDVFFGSLFIGAYAFDAESLAVRNTFGAMLRMTTPCGQVLVFICRFVVYVS